MNDICKNGKMKCDGFLCYLAMTKQCVRKNCLDCSEECAFFCNCEICIFDNDGTDTCK